MAGAPRGGDSDPMQKRDVSTVYLVDDFEPIRQALRDLLAQGAGAEVVGEADSVASAIEGILTTRPRFAVLDYRLPDGTGVDVLRAVAGAARETVFIMLTNHVTAPVRAACTGAGAHYFLDKSREFDRLNAIVAGSPPQRTDQTTGGA
jgi:DNA-binding NarL/FixJ family response regulator